MNAVLTPDGWGQVLRTQSARGRTSYLVKGAGFEGWYDGLEVTADFADHPDDVVPNAENDTVLPYPSRPQGPGWDGTTSTIQPDIDPHLEIGHASDSLTGEDTDEDPVKADIEGLFEPHSRLAGARIHRLHFATSDDPILDVSTIPEDSPTGLENSPINPDHVSTDDLFSDEPLLNLEYQSATRLVIQDDLSFLKTSSDEDDDGDDHKREQRDSSDDRDSDNSDSDSSDGDSDDDDDDDDESDSSGDDDSSSDDGGSSGGGDGSGGGGHTAAYAFALTTTADLHFLANMCSCDESIPLHSKGEHRELKAEAFAEEKHESTPPGSRGPANGVTPQKYDQAELDERYRQDQLFHPAPLDLVDHSNDDGDGADLYNHYASVGKQADDGYDKYIGGSDGNYYLIASGGGKLPKGEHYGHYDSYQDAHDAVEAIIARNHAHASTKTAAPAQQEAGPTQIESQIEQLMQFWAVDNNGWWHWTGSQADLALLNQMQQQMTAVGMPGGPPGQMQAQSAFQIESNTPAHWREYLQLVASDRLVALAAWKDVVDKSKRLRAEGAISVEVFKPEVITAYIQGDNGKYYTTVQRLGSAPGASRQLTSTQVSGWSCECDWGQWAWLRKRSFVGRMCSHAYALFSEMRSLDAKARRGKGKPLSAGKFANANNKTTWARSANGGFEWVTDDPTMPTAMIVRTANNAWSADVWSDGTADDSLSLGTFKHSEYARRAVAQAIIAHVKFSAPGDVDLVSDQGAFKPFAAPDSIAGGGDNDPYSEDGDPETELPADEQGGSAGIQEGTTRVGYSVFAEAKDGDDDEGPEVEDNGIEEEDPADDDEDLDEEIAEDENDGDSDDGEDDEGDEPDDDGGHEEPHKRDDSDDDDEGTDNPGDDSDDDGIEKHSSVTELQERYGLTHLAGANYSLSEQDNLVREGDGKTARNRGDLNLAGTHYEAAVESPEDTLAFLF